MIENLQNKTVSDLNDEMSKEVNISNRELNIEDNKNKNIFKQEKMNDNSINNSVQKLEEEPISYKKYDWLEKVKEFFHLFNKSNIIIFLKKHLFNKTDIIFYITNILSILFYYLGLIPCEKDPSECTIKRGMIFYFTVGIFTAISAILFSVYVSYSLFKRKHLIHYIYTVPIFIFFIITKNGAETVDHGFYNACGFLLVITILSHHYYSSL